MKNKEIIDAYLSYRRDIEKKAIDSTLSTAKRSLNALSDCIKKSFKDATQDDISKYLNQYVKTTYNNRIAILKPFYRWLFKIEKGDKEPDCIRKFNSIPTKQLRKEKEANYKERIVTDSEYQRMLDVARIPRDRAIFEVLNYFGVRASELCSMKLGGVKYDGEFTRVTVEDSKTIPRDVIERGRFKELMTYVESYHYYRNDLDKKNKPLWVNRDKKSLTKDGLGDVLRGASRRAEIGRIITAHDFRHTSISRDRSKGIPITHIETKHGLVHGSNMMSIYDHNKTKDYENYLRHRSSKEENPTYEALEHQKKKLEDKHMKETEANQKEILELKQKIDIIVQQISHFAESFAEVRMAEARNATKK